MLNYPTEKTKMTREHKLFYKGQMICAYNFLGKFPGVNKVEYRGDTLYNILMENNEKIIVNNIVCETLDPQNIIAKLYLSNFEFTPEIIDIQNKQRKLEKIIKIRNQPFVLSNLFSR
jgi:hypothetical protein